MKKFKNFVFDVGYILICIWLFLGLLVPVFFLIFDFKSTIAIAIVIGAIFLLSKVLPKGRDGTNGLLALLGILALGQIDSEREASNDEDDFIRSKWDD